MVARRSVGATVLAVCTVLVFSGCLFSSQKREFDRGVKAMSHGDFDQGFQLLERVIQRDHNSKLAIEAARRGARTAYLEAKDYKRALDFNRQIVLLSSESEERVNAQKQIAEIEFSDLANYEQAIIEYNKLLSLPHSAGDGFHYQLNVAKAYFQLNNFVQSGVEADELMTKPLNEDQKFEVLLFKANLYLTDKKLDAASNAFMELLTKYPERAQKENVPLNLSVCYEEKGEFVKAIQILRDMKSYYPTPDFIDLKIRRLQERAANLPGAEGLRK
jgi:tetratricopeptide (TPR) repeat protein